MPSVGTDWVRQPFRSLGKSDIAFLDNGPCPGTELEDTKPLLYVYQGVSRDASASSMAETTE
jgi:hypothetical protein